MTSGRILFLLVLSCTVALARGAYTITPVPLDDAHCETFTVGESGHSERCQGPGGFDLIIHDRRDRVDIEVVHPGEKRNPDVLRLSGYLGPGRRNIRTKTVDWITDKNALPVGFALHFDVEPQAYETNIPFTLVLRISKDNACVVATIGEASSRTVEGLLKKFDELECRKPFRFN